MADLTQYRDTAVNFGDAEGTEKLELLFALNAIGTLVIIAPLVYVFTESVFFFSFVAVLALAEIPFSQYFIKQMDDDPSDD
jgi:hypothetical protein